MGELVQTLEGWHRFQVVVEGQNNIHCAVDGRTTAFSPVTESTFTVLQPGIMVTAPAAIPFTCYADNLSIQWSMDVNAPLPLSPWSAPFVPSAAPAAPGTPTLDWLADANDAWYKSQQDQRPILMMLYDPNSLAYQELFNNVFRLNTAAQELLARFTRLRTDVNQLGGGTLARQYTVVRVPTFIVLGLDGKEKGRVEANKNPDWTVIGPTLERILALASAGAQPAAAQPGAYGQPGVTQPVAAGFGRPAAPAPPPAVGTTSFGQPAAAGFGQPAAGAPTPIPPPF
jgi:hypothetical protein